MPQFLLQNMLENDCVYTALKLQNPVFSDKVLLVTMTSEKWFLMSRDSSLKSLQPF